MQQLFLLLYQYRAALIFILFEVLCAWLIVQNNFYQRARFFNSSNVIAANILTVSDNVSDYFNLTEVNKQLAEENAALRAMIEQGSPAAVLYTDSVLFADSTTVAEDTAAVMSYNYITAKVIGNSIRRLNNYITINKGRSDGVERGMGVIGPEGVVGSVKAVSSNFAVINSLLHTDIMVSAKVKRTQDLGTIRWGGVDFTKASLRYVPRHVEIQPGDTVVTSGYNALFPPGILIGVVETIEEREETQFYDITIDLSVDFNELSYVYVIENLSLPEIDSLKKEAIEWLPQE